MHTSILWEECNILWTLKKVVHMQRMPVFVSPEPRNAEAHWLEKANPHNFSFLTALKVETAVQSCLGRQTAAGQNARMKIIQLNKYPLQYFSQSVRRGGKIAKLLVKKLFRVKNAV
jgi:hypothetical protein